MSVKIYNSLTREKEEFKPLKDKIVKIYACGVTVYDDCHIGHARSLYIFEVIRRYLKYRGFKVKFIRNITDIDDKIINRAKEIKMDWRQLVKKYINKYYEDLAALGIPKADGEPRATENIPAMVKHIKGLIKKGFAYVTESGVYFSVRKFKEYGKLSGQNIEVMLKAVRIDAQQDKHDPLDFALWKKSEEGEPFWNSPWGRGRPGWHIECSVMSQKYLKTKTLDIHAGGRDLIFPHHENEIAQSEALSNKPFAKYWIHHGLLTINGQKMAKSLGNFITIKDFIAKYRNVDLLKLFFLSAHYSHPLDYNQEKMEEVKKSYDRFRILFNKIKRECEVRDTAKLSSDSLGDIALFREEFEKAMDDDFNAPLALSVLFNIVNECNKILDDKEDSRRFLLRCAMKTIIELGNILGLSFKDISVEEELDTWITVAIAQREQLRKEGKYAQADEIRKDLEKKGIIIEDTKEGATWRRKS